MGRHTRARAPLRHRRTTFDFADVPIYWNDGDVFLTRFLDALSVNFPDGERFFIESVRAFEHAVEDPALREDIRLFVRQEAQHGVAHDRFNETLRNQGVNVERIIKTLRGDMRFAQTRLSPKMQLAITAAAEHLTATLAEGFIELVPELMQNAHPAMRSLYLWHAVEEIEHKSVAFDVLEQSGENDYATRVLAMFAIVVYLHLRVGALMRHMLTVDGLVGRRSLVALGLFRMYGPRGYLTKMTPRFLAWFRPGFHPSDSPTPREVTTWVAEYEQHQDPRRATERVFPDTMAHAA